MPLPLIAAAAAAAAGVGGGGGLGLGGIVGAASGLLGLLGGGKNRQPQGPVQNAPRGGSRPSQPSPRMPSGGVIGSIASGAGGIVQALTQPAITQSSPDMAANDALRFLGIGKPKEPTPQQAQENAQSNFWTQVWSFLSMPIVLIPLVLVGIWLLYKLISGFFPSYSTKRKK